ncbi:hypothetical protein AGMMS4952_17990 [Spirochaetia bacterium]|nr:hypothetical protein AGMMS4952_17990 [Spirochaetia bacterium]
MKMTPAAAALLLVLPLLSSCPNGAESVPFLVEPASLPLAPGMGRVLVSTGRGQVRTLMPETPVFTKYTLAFTASEKNTVEVALTESGDISSLEGPGGYQVDLEEATWNLDVTAWTETAGVYRKAAKGTASVTVTAGSIAATTPSPIPIIPYPIDSTEAEGTFKWTITLPPSLSSAGGDTAKLILTKDGTLLPSIHLIDYAAGTLSSGSVSLAAGYYDVTVLLAKGTTMNAGRSEAAHIYPGLETKWTFGFTDGDFVSMKYLAGTARVNDGTNSVTSGAITIKVYTNSTYTTQIITDPPAVTVTTNGGNYTMKVPVDEQNFYFRLERNITVNGGPSWVYSGNNDNPIGWSGLLSGETGVNLAITIPNIVAYREPTAGTKYFYDNLRDAIDASTGTSAANPDTITLLDDIPVTASITIGNTKHVKLEAAGNRTIQWNSVSTNDSVIIVESGGSLELTGTSGNTLTIDGNNMACETLINLEGTLTMGDYVTLKDSKSNSNIGGAVFVWGGNAVFTMSGGSITGNTSETGGGVRIFGGSFIMKGGSITANQATGGANIGGGVYVDGDNGSKHSSFTMEGGTIGGSEADKNSAGSGGGVYVKHGSFTMSGGTITGNEVTGSGGGVFVNGTPAAATFTMSGTDTTTKITGNKAAISGVSYTDGDPIPDDGGGGVYVDGANSSFILSGGIIGGIGNGNTAGNSTSGIGLGGGVYVKLGSFSMTGGSITGNQADADTGSGVGIGGGVFVKDGVFTMTSGYITGNQTTGVGKVGGGVGVYGDIAPAAFTLSGGTIEDSIGGGVGVSNAIFTMTSGFIKRNTGDYGGGVHVKGTGSIFTMTGGTIGGTGSDANTAIYGGGGVYADDSSTFILSNGTITGNGTTGSGGGVYVYRSTFTMSDGTISNNGIDSSNRPASGGGVYVDGGSFTMSGGDIDNNTANTVSGYGGGVYLKGSNNTTFKKTGGGFSGNTATSPRTTIAIESGTYKDGDLVPADKLYARYDGTSSNWIYTGDGISDNW